MLKPITANQAQKDFTASFIREDPANPRLEKLKRDYGLEKIVAPGKTELDKLLLLTDWTFDRIPRFGRPTMQTEEALTILENAHDNLFYCAHYAAVYVACATALGWEARLLSQRLRNVSYRASNHNVVELWSRQFSRWIYVDPTHSFLFTKDGVPLNCYEIGREWFKHQGENLKIIRGSEKKEYTVADLPLIFREFFHKDGLVQLDKEGMNKFAVHAWVPTNRFLDPAETRSMERWDDWPGIVIINGFDRDWNDDWEQLAPYYKLG